MSHKMATNKRTKSAPDLCQCPSCSLNKGKKKGDKGAPPTIPLPGNKGLARPNLSNKLIPVGMEQHYRQVPKETLNLPKVT